MKLKVYTLFLDIKSHHSVALYTLCLTLVLLCNKMDFLITPGKRINSKLIFCENHLYSYKSTEKSVDYYECYKKCGVRIKIENGKCHYVNVEKRVHSHGSQDDVYKKLCLENTMKIRCSVENKRPRDVFNEEVNSHQASGSDLQYSKRRKTLKYHQNKGIPKNPTTLDEVKEYFEAQEIIKKFSTTLNEIDPRPFYQGTVIKPNFAYMILSSELILTDLPIDLKIRIDATFKIVPKGPFKQLLIMSCDHLDHVS